MDNSKNTYLAMGLSILVIVLWQYFYVGPRVEAERRAAEIEAGRQAASTQQNPNVATDTGTDGVPTATKPGALNNEAGVPGSAVANNNPAATRQEIIASSQRVTFETESLIGSINLKGARVDDLRLKKYHDTIDPKSPLIELLSPAGTATAYFAEFGFAGEDKADGVPGPQYSLENRGRTIHWQWRRSGFELD